MYLLCHIHALEQNFILIRSSHLEVFLGKSVRKICSKFTKDYPSRSAVSIKLQNNSIEIALRHGCSPVNLRHIFRASFRKNTFSGPLLCDVNGIGLKPTTS